MGRRRYVQNLYFYVIWVLVFLMVGCDTGIEDSPDPGILRITLESDQSDTTIIIVRDTLTVSYEDIFRIKIFQGKAFQDSMYGVLYDTITSNSQIEKYYNLIRRENNQYVRFTIFESFLPPFNFNKVSFGIDATSLKLKNFDLIEVVTPSNYFIELPVDFNVSGNGLTEVNVRVAPFKYIERYKDIYIFAPEMEVIGVNYY